MNKRLLLLFILFSTFVTGGKIVIKSKLLKSNFKGMIFYNEPLDGFINMFYNDKSVPLKKDSTFQIETSLQKDGFIVIRLPGKMIKLFVQPTDTISFEVLFTADLVQKRYLFKDICFVGDNAAGHKAFALSEAYSNMQGFVVVNLFSQKITREEFNEQLLLTLKEILRPFDSLYKNKQIDGKFYDVIAADLKSFFCSEVINSYASLLAFKEKEASRNTVYKHYYDALAVNRTLLTKKHFDSTKTFLYANFDPFDSNIHYSFIGKHYTSKFTEDIKNGLLSSSIPYDTAFTNFKEIAHYGYLKGAFLMNLWQSHLYWSASYEPDGATLQKQLSLFKEYFPTSPFLPYLTKRLKTAIRDRALSKKVDPSIQFLQKAKYTSLKALIQENFSGEYVFVDLWATWCSPCIQDFMYKNELKAFLETKSIKPLYISIDKESDRDKWCTFVTTKELQGFHSLASEQLVEDIKQVLYHNDEVMIPRYLLINKKGEIIGSDLPRPSDLEKLKITIDKLLLKDSN